MAMAVYTYAAEFPDKYHTVAEVNTELDSLASEYPEIIKVDTLGYSTQYNTPILYAKISDNPYDEEDEPAVLLHGAMHADEVLGVEALMFWLDTLTIRYSVNDTNAIRWIENIELYVVPILNVEGHIKVEGGLTWWRKTCRDNNLNGVFDSLIDGVDLNRNFSLGWDSGPTDTSDFFYRGPWPFSETEARAIREISYEKQFVIAIDYHSPTYGRADVIYYPWNRGEMGGLAADKPVLQDIATNMGLKILRDDGERHYDYVNGGSGNGFHRVWQYNRFATVAFTCEISDTTIQDTTLVDLICRHHVPGIEYLMDRALGTGVNGLVTDEITGEPLWAQARVLQAFHPGMARRYTNASTGRYRRLLLPGIYTLEFEAEGYQTKRFYNFHVLERYPTVFDVQLQLNPAITSVDEIYLPDIYGLSQNYPNPFNAVTTINYSVGLADYNGNPKDYLDVSLDIYNLRGAKIKTLVEDELPNGNYSVSWDGRDGRGNSVASGVYFYCLRIDNNYDTRKMLLIK
ncbi:MAG: hypothetical protein GY855_06480 [candidate division Zixibacteria bacterium]|nr:hypothetical protein [candidate division Zixibacteria bacterium]